MRKAQLLLLNFVWLVIAFIPLIYGQEIFAVRDPYRFWIGLGLVVNFIANHLIILYELKFSCPDFKLLDWLGRIPVAFVLMTSYIYVLLLTIDELNLVSSLTVIIGVTLFIPLLTLIALVLGLIKSGIQDTELNLEKRKRDRLDAVLRDLSDEDLIRLRQRLADKSINDDLLYEHIMDTDEDLREKDY